jgi:PAS domain S-box-containing protein
MRDELKTKPQLISELKEMRSLILNISKYNNDGLGHFKKLYRDNGITSIESKEIWAWGVNNDYEFIFVSAKVKNILGYNSNEMLFKIFYDFIPEEEKEFAIKILSLLKNERLSSWNVKFRMNHKNGNVILVEYYALAMFDEANNINGYEGIAYEVT